MAAGSKVVPDFIAAGGEPQTGDPSLDNCSAVDLGIDFTTAPVPTVPADSFNPD